MIRRARLNVHEQAAWMRHHLPHFRSTVRGRELVCRGVLQPTPLSREYKVVIQYELGQRPRVFVPGGQLQPRTKNEPIPHTYADDEPCLYDPKNCEWRPDMKIATSIVSWLSLWLTYYEVWRATGDWQGGGVEHNVGDVRTA